MIILLILDQDLSGGPKNFLFTEMKANYEFWTGTLPEDHE